MRKLRFVGVSKFLLVLFLSCFVLFCGRAENHADTASVHELTLYLIPSPEPIVWESPSKLYTSFFNSYSRGLFEFKEEKYLLGHLFVGISSPLVEKPYLIGISSASKKEKKQFLLKDKIGFSILNIDLKGRLESTKELEQVIKHYLRHEELVHITYKVNEHGLKRVLKFIEVFSTKFNDRHAPCDFYGGAFNPRYQFEGSGCSALGLTMLELCGISLEPYSEWFVSVKIPMNIIGGEYNHGKKVTIKEMKGAHQWYSGEGTEGVDYVRYSVYDPSIIYRWVKNQLTKADLEKEKGFIACSKNGIPGLFIDFSQVVVPENEPIFFQREQPSIYIDRYLNKIGVNSHPPVSAVDSE